MTERPDLPYREITSYRDGWLAEISYFPDTMENEPTDDQDALQTLLRAAAFETGAVEDLYQSERGATRMIAEEDEGWEDALAHAGAGAGDHFKDQLNAYEFARDYAHGAGEHPINEALIREVHTIATASQTTYDTDAGPKPLHHGEYKRSANYVVDRFGRRKWYCPHERLPAELRATIDIYRELETRNAAPTDKARVLSALLHWAIAHIHPFEDGNGRVARIVASIPTIRGNDVPVLVFKDQKNAYLQALDEADAGEPRAFIGYTLGRIRSVIAWRRHLIEAREEVSFDSLSAQLAEILAAQEGQNTEPLQIVLTRVGEYLRRAVKERLQAFANRNAATVQVAYPVYWEGEMDLTPTATDNLVEYATAHLSTETPLPAHANSRVSVGILTGTRDVTTIVGNDILTLPFEACSPTLTNEAIIQLDLHAQAGTLRLAKAFVDEVKRTARAKGSLPFEHKPL
ncbi:hypothetical protein GCM10009775_32840 [Microbacterium aoyamense]|uniref:Fido domain-containing protein n=1 Tax=Microbacterium aoyamense TaxID=344166 RepID=A0ABP5B9U2_9MICO|nr:Fic family protein [Microbacterium aoyamense]